MKKLFLFVLLLVPVITHATFPSVRSSSQDIKDSAANSITLTWPATVESDDILLCFVAVFDDNGISTAESGVSELFEVDANRNSIAIYAKDADGTEDSGTWTVTTDGAQAEKWTWHCWAIQDTFDGTNANSVTTATDFDGGSVPSTVSNCPSLNPAGWGTEDTLWVCFAGWASDVAADMTSYPAACTDNQSNQETTIVDSGLCSDEEAAASKDFAAFTISGGASTNDTWAAATVAIRPASSGNPLRRRRGD